MIRSFKSKETEKIFRRERTKKFSKSIQKIAQHKLNMIHAATTIKDLRIPPANHLEKLIGKRQGQHSIRINQQWRICFKWKGNYAEDVEIIDYHK